MKNQCAAVTKFGSTTYICDLELGHHGDHAMWTGRTKLAWPQEVW